MLLRAPLGAGRPIGCDNAGTQAVCLHGRLSVVLLVGAVVLHASLLGERLGTLYNGEV